MLGCFVRPVLTPGSSNSSSDEMSPSDEDEGDGIGIPACTPLAAFLSFKQDAEKRRASQVQLEATGKVPELCSSGSTGAPTCPHLPSTEQFFFSKRCNNCLNLALKISLTQV